MMKRLYSIDILRAVAILTMVLVHFVDNLSPYTARYKTLYTLADTLGSFSAPIFTFLVGMSLALSLEKQRRQGRPPSQIAIRAIRRGLLVFFLGLAFEVFIWQPTSIFDWDILTFIGAAILILYPLRNRSTGTLLAISLIVLLISPFLREVSAYAAHWNRWAEYSYKFTTKDVTLGFFLNGYFPLFPWLIYPLIGMVVGKRTVNRGEQGLLTIALLLLALAAIGTILNETVAGIWSRYASPITFYPATTTFLLGTLGTILLIFWGLYRRLDAGTPQKSPGWLIFFQRYSRFSLTVYVVHHAAHVWPLYLAAWLQGHSDPWYYYADAVSIPTAWLFTLVFIVAFYGVIAQWEKRGGKYSFEWVLGRLVG